MSDTPTFTINFDRKCAECRQDNGVAQNDLCLKCTAKAISGRVMRSDAGRAVQQRFFRDKERR